MSSEQTETADLDDPLQPPENSTSARNLLTVALRILGFWLICTAIIGISQIAAYAIYAMLPSNNLGDSIYVLLMTVVQVGGPAAVGITVILLAGRISRRIYPSSEPTANSIAFGRVGAGDLYHIASFVMGVYMLIQAVGPGVRFLAGTMKTGPTSMGISAGDGVFNMIPAAVYSLSGIVLIFGSRGIAQAMVAVPRNSDEVPVPQFGIRSLLILGVVFAVVLGVLRMVMGGIR